jgi:hypothetical protein
LDRFRILSIFTVRQGEKSMPETAPRIVVKLSADLAKSIPYQDDVVSVFPADIRATWNSLLPQATLDRALPMVNSDEVRHRLNLNEHENGSPSENLLAFFVISAPPGFDAKALAAAARSLDFVEHSYVESQFVLAGVQFADDPLVVAQGYLGPKPVGVDAIHAWSKDGGDGAGVKFVDLENGFFLNHEDLVDPNGVVRVAVLPTGTASSNINDLDHSTAVLGVVLATDNSKGIVGIAPNVQAFAAPIFPGAPVNLDDALIRVWLNPSFGLGTVVLIEYQDFFGGPVESDLFVRSTIRELTRSGFTVVVPAGNGGRDLDIFDDGHGRIFDRNNAAFFDSGAIMVSAATPVLNDRYVGAAHGPSSHGNRIDCFAWGDGIMTASAKPILPGALNGYTDGLTSTSGLFGGASGASAIISGAAILLQSLHLKRHGSFLQSANLRELLKDITFNTPPAPAATGRIGVMPDLQRLSQEIGIS